MIIKKNRKGTKCRSCYRSINGKYRVSEGAEDEYKFHLDCFLSIIDVREWKYKEKLKEIKKARVLIKKKEKYMVAERL
jgi:hypothetical protein